MTISILNTTFSKTNNITHTASAMAAGYIKTNFLFTMRHVSATKRQAQDETKKQGIYMMSAEIMPLNPKEPNNTALYNTQISVLKN